MTEPSISAVMLQLIEELCEVGRDSVARGLALASGGNLSVREPDSNMFAVTGSGTHLDTLVGEDFSIMSMDGDVLYGHPKPSSEWKLHQRAYLARPDVNCVVHLHPQKTVLLDALGHKIRLLTLDHAVYVKSIGRAPYYPNGSDELADSAGEQARDHNCVILGNHGSSTLGGDVEMAYRRALNLEQAAALTFNALQLGDTDTDFPADGWEGLHHA